MCAAYAFEGKRKSEKGRVKKICLHSHLCIDALPSSHRLTEPVDANAKTVDCVRTINVHRVATVHECLTATGPVAIRKSVDDDRWQCRTVDATQ